VLGELAELFPADVLHIGGDEVAPGSWLKSPAAQALMAAEGLAGTPELQAHFMRRVQAILAAHGKTLGGWEEVAHGGGIAPENTLLTAWTNAKAGAELAAAGYDVVMAPGQAYYLDMVQAEAWAEPGASWAGTVPPRQSYDFDAESAFPPGLRHRLKGVQACIWSENLVSRGLFNRLVFPRLSAIAEAAWTAPEGKNWQRFCALSRLMPQL
jgi:hexosaminidase